MGRTVHPDDAKTARLDIPVTKAFLAKLDRLAATEGRTRTDYARRIIVLALEAHA